jgi:hypothetical protein
MKLSELFTKALESYLEKEEKEAERIESLRK